MLIVLLSTRRKTWNAWHEKDWKDLDDSLRMGDIKTWADSIFSLQLQCEEETLAQDQAQHLDDLISRLGFSETVDDG